MVVNGAQTEAMLFGPDGVAGTMANGAVFISSATMDPAVARRLAKRWRLSASIIWMRRYRGGAQGGERRTDDHGVRLQTAFDKARPALDAMAGKVYELGDAAGPGAAFKMINQLLAGVHIAAACEAITFAAKQGLDLERSMR